MIIPSLREFESKRGRGQRLDLVDVVAGIFYIMHEGIRWRALPAVFGKWQSAYTRFYRCTKSGAIDIIWRAVAEELQQGKLRSLDASHVKVHQDANVKNPQDEAIGMTKGGRNTKIHALADEVGHAVELDVTPGQNHDSTNATKMTADIEPEKIVLADKAYDVDALRKDLTDRGIEICIPPKSNRKSPASYDKETYKKRHHVENFFQRAKRCRRIGTRYEKTKMMFLSFVTLFAIVDYYLH